MSLFITEPPLLLVYHPKKSYPVLVGVGNSPNLLPYVAPYTAYNARLSYLEENPNVIEGFTKAIQKGLDYVHNHSSKDIAKLLVDYFPDTSLDDLTTLVERHKEIDSWFTTTEITEKDFNHIQDIMISAGELKTKVPYNKLVK